MLNTFEAIYENGRLKWLRERPETGRHHVLVTVLDRNAAHSQRDEVQQVLETTRGAWGHGKTLEMLDAELDHIRTEWDRPL